MDTVYTDKNNHDAPRQKAVQFITWTNRSETDSTISWIRQIYTLDHRLKAIDSVTCTLIRTKRKNRMPFPVTVPQSGTVSANDFMKTAILKAPGNSAMVKRLALSSAIMKADRICHYGRWQHRPLQAAEQHSPGSGQSYDCQPVAYLLFRGTGIQGSEYKSFVYTADHHIVRTQPGHHKAGPVLDSFRYLCAFEKQNTA